MGQIEVLPVAPSKVEGTKPLFVRPAGYAPYVPPPIPDAVPEAPYILECRRLSKLSDKPKLVPETALAVVAPEPTAITMAEVAKPQAYLSTEPGWWDSFWRDRARNKLQRALARIIQISQDHESNGVKPGDPIYHHLYGKALELCHWHFDKWHLDRGHIEIEIPCMRQLRLSAHPESIVAAHKAPVAMFGIIAVIALPLVIGAWTGLFGIGQRWILHLFGG